MSEPTRGLLAALTLHQTDARTREDIFTADNEFMPHGRVFGGQVLGQSLMAAVHTTESDRSPHSLHGYFLRPGRIDVPITYAVDRIHDGRSFSTRRTQAYQEGVPIFSMIASFQTEDRGVDHQIAFPTGLPTPEDLQTDEEWINRSGNDSPRAKKWSNGRNFDFRHVGVPNYVAAEPSDGTGWQAVWMKAQEALPDDANIHRAALAYASDWLILEGVRRRHRLPWNDPRVKAASLDHAMWWHRPARADEWLLYTQESPTAIGGRGLGTGYIFTRDGELVATVAQEGMMRVPEEFLDA